MGERKWREQITSFDGFYCEGEKSSGVGPEGFGNQRRLFL